MGKRLVVIGAGMAGLSAALTWAQNMDVGENPVVLVDKAPHVGGAVTTYTRKGFHIDTCQMISNVSAILNYFKLDMDLKSFNDPLAHICLVDANETLAKVLELPGGRQPFLNYLCCNYPVYEKKLQSFWQHGLEMYHEINKLKAQLSFWDKGVLLFRCPKIIRFHKYTFQQYLNHFGLDHPELLEIFSMFSLLGGLPPGRIAALLPLGVMFSLLEQAYRPRSDFSILPQQLKKRFEAFGGKVLLKSEVVRILNEQNKVTGVVLEDGTHLEADYVISTIDPKFAMNHLIELDCRHSKQRRFMDKLDETTMTSSAFTVNIGLDTNFDLSSFALNGGYQLVTTGGKTYDKLYAAHQENRMAYDDRCFQVGVSCPTLTTGEPPLLTLSAMPVPMSQWRNWREREPQYYREQKEKWADFFIEKVEMYLIRDLRKHIVMRDIATPATYARYSGSPSGSLYDMESTPRNFGATRLPMKTPIDGLLQPKFAHGVFGTMNGGMQAVDYLLDGRVMNGFVRFH